MKWLGFVGEVRVDFPIFTRQSSVFSLHLVCFPDPDLEFLLPGRW
jgi:hypothetical protein